MTPTTQFCVGLLEVDPSGLFTPEQQAHVVAWWENPQVSAENWYAWYEATAKRLDCFLAKFQLDAEHICAPLLLAGKKRVCIPVDQDTQGGWSFLVFWRTPEGLTWAFQGVWIHNREASSVLLNDPEWVYWLAVRMAAARRYFLLQKIYGLGYQYARLRALGAKDDQVESEDVLGSTLEALDSRLYRGPDWVFYR